MANKDVERNITYEEIYEYSKQIRQMTRKGYSTKRSRARANETIEINRLELATILHKCGLVAYGYETYTKRYLRACHLKFACAYGEDTNLYKIQKNTRKSLHAKC